MNVIDTPTTTLDIETLPDMRDGALDAFRAAVQENFKAPSDMTKEKACADLGMTDNDEIKFTSKANALDLWAARFKEEKSEEVAQAEWRKTSFDGSRGRIAVIGLQFNDESPIAFYRGDYRDPDAEREILTDAFEAIADNFSPQSMRNPLYVGHYVAQFDLRFLFQRAVILGIKPPAIIPFQAKPWGDDIFDTMTRWCGAQGSIKLDALCAALGVIGKTEGIDGSMVLDMVLDGRIDDVADYCCDDVTAAYRCYRKMTFNPVSVRTPQELCEIPF